MSSLEYNDHYYDTTEHLEQMHTQVAAERAQNTAICMLVKNKVRRNLILQS